MSHTACLHRNDNAAHWVLWPALGYRSRTRTGTITRHHAWKGHGTYVGIPARTNATWGWSCHSSATRRHLIRTVAGVWQDGRLVSMGALYWCGAMTCMALFEGDPPDHLTPCPRCVEVAG